VIFHWYKYCIGCLRNMLSLFIHCCHIVWIVTCFSALHDITHVCRRRNDFMWMKIKKFLCMRILLNIHGCTILQKSRSYVKILGMGRVTYWGFTNIRCLHTKFCWHGHLVSGIMCTPVHGIKNCHKYDCRF
jgi:hypothetical protein